MSATINEETFVKYFDDAPLLRIPGSTHPITDRLVHTAFILSFHHLMSWSDIWKTLFLPLLTVPLQGDGGGCKMTKISRFSGTVR